MYSKSCLANLSVSPKNNITDASYKKKFFFTLLLTCAVLCVHIWDACPTSPYPPLYSGTGPPYSDFRTFKIVKI